jgi:hypothetical protein
MCKFIESSIVPRSRACAGCCDAHDICRDKQPSVDISQSLCPHLLTSNLVSHAQALTMAQRQYMEANPHHRGPVSYKDYPGKLDHTSCVCIKASVINADVPADMNTLPLHSPRSD